MPSPRGGHLSRPWVTPKGPHPSWVSILLLLKSSGRAAPARARRRRHHGRVPALHACVPVAAHRGSRVGRASIRPALLGRGPARGCRRAPTAPRASAARCVRCDTRPAAYASASASVLSMFLPRAQGANAHASRPRPRASVRAATQARRLTTTTRTFTAAATCRRALRAPSSRSASDPSCWVRFPLRLDAPSRHVIARVWLRWAGARACAARLRVREAMCARRCTMLPCISRLAALQASSSSLSSGVAFCSS